MGAEKQVVIAVDGMSCGHCVMAVKRALSAIEGVKDAAVTLDPPRAVVTFDPDKTGIGPMAAAIAAEGYTVPQ